MLSLVGKIEKQLEKKNFWVVDKDWIIELGKAVKALDGYHMNWLLKGVV